MDSDKFSSTQGTSMGILQSLRLRISILKSQDPPKGPSNTTDSAKQIKKKKPMESCYPEAVTFIVNGFLAGLLEAGLFLPPFQSDITTQAGVSLGVESGCCLLALLLHCTQGQSVHTDQDQAPTETRARHRQGSACACKTR